MKTGLSTAEMQEALARVERARNERGNAGRRLSRAQDAVQRATREVGECDEELRQATAHLDQVVRRGMALALKKGGVDASIAIAEVMARVLGGGDQSPQREGQEPASHGSREDGGAAPEAGPETSPTDGANDAASGELPLNAAA